MGYQNPTGYKVLAPQKKKHKIIHSETSLQHEKKQNNKETNIKPIISSLLPDHPEKPTKTYPNAKSTHYHQKKKKNYPK